jgi:hypothetical protein
MPHSQSRNKTWQSRQLERKLRAASKQNAEYKSDTQHVAEQPSAPTELYLKRLAYSEAKKAAMKAKREGN